MHTQNFKYGSFLSLVMLYMVGTLGIFSSYYTEYHRSVFQMKVSATAVEQLVRLSFSEKEYHQLAWTEKNKEFEWEGKMYDVSGIIHTETGIDILCENDSLEEMLISLFNPDKQHDAGQAKKGNPQPQFFQQDWSMFSATAFREHQKYAEACPSCYHSHKGCISHPPPEAGRVG